MFELTVDLKGKGVIVSAAGGNIGSGCALALARCGASLALNDVNEEALDAVCERVREIGVPVIKLPGDVSDYAVVQNMAEAAIAGLGNVFGSRATLQLFPTLLPFPQHGFGLFDSQIGRDRSQNGQWRPPKHARRSGWRHRRRLFVGSHLRGHCFR